MSCPASTARRRHAWIWRVSSRALGLPAASRAAIGDAFMPRDEHGCHVASVSKELGIPYPPLVKNVKGPIPSLATLWEVERIMMRASEKEDDPISLAEIGRRMSAKRVRHSTVRACIDFLSRVGVVTTGSKGAQWSFTTDARFWKAAAAGKSLL